ncbi:unnamed protein product [Closterium sp. Naga37s-1]|nr:unnamed protein product [Closterium sp. Naga37s-1]
MAPGLHPISPGVRLIASAPLPALPVRWGVAAAAAPVGRSSKAVLQQRPRRQQRGKPLIKEQQVDGTQQLQQLPQQQQQQKQQQQQPPQQQHQQQQEQPGLGFGDKCSGASGSGKGSSSSSSSAGIAGAGGEGVGLGSARGCVATHAAATLAAHATSGANLKQAGGAPVSVNWKLAGEGVSELDQQLDVGLFGLQAWQGGAEVGLCERGADCEKKEHCEPTRCAVTVGEAGGTCETAARREEEELGSGCGKAGEGCSGGVLSQESCGRGGSEPITAAAAGDDSKGKAAIKDGGVCVQHREGMGEGEDVVCASEQKGVWNGRREKQREVAVQGVDGVVCPQSEMADGVVDSEDGVDGVDGVNGVNGEEDGVVGMDGLGELDDCMESVVELWGELNDADIASICL